MRTHDDIFITAFLEAYLGLHFTALHVFLFFLDEDGCDEYPVHFELSMN